MILRIVVILGIASQAWGAENDHSQWVHAKIEASGAASTLELRRASMQSLGQWVIALQRESQVGNLPAVETTRLVESALEQAVRLGNDADPQIRREAFRLMIYAQAAETTTTDWLLGILLNEGNPTNRAKALTDMAFAGHDSPRFVATLLQDLRSSHPIVKEHAAQAIRQVRPPNALDALMSALDDSSMVRDFTVEAIAEYGTSATVALPKLREMLGKSQREGSLPQALHLAIAKIEGSEPFEPPQRTRTFSLTTANVTQMPWLKSTPAEASIAAANSTQVLAESEKSPTTSPASQPEGGTYWELLVAIVVFAAAGCAALMLFQKKSPSSTV